MTILGMAVLLIGVSSEAGASSIVEDAWEKLGCVRAQYDELCDQGLSNEVAQERVDCIERALAGTWPWMQRFCESDQANALNMAREAYEEIIERLRR